MIMIYKKKITYRTNYLHYMCRQWNKNHPENPVVSIEMFYLESKIPRPDDLHTFDYQILTRQESLMAINCR